MRRAVGILKEAVAALLYYTGMIAAARSVAGSRRSRGTKRPPPTGNSRVQGLDRFLVLIYHRVSERIDPFSIVPIPASLFDRQVAHVARHYSVLPLHSIVACLAAGKPLPGRTVAITFDDGYRDNYEHAWPILCKHSVPATIFLTSGLIGTAQVPWFDRVLAMFRDTQASALELPHLRLRFLLGTEAARRQAAFQLLLALKRLPPPEPDQTIQELEERLGPARSCRPLMLRWEEVREMHATGIEFGAHTVTHRILSSVPIEAASDEIQRSKDQIEQALGAPVAGFAYPNGNSGDFDAAVARRVARAGFSYAVTNIRGVNGHGSDPFQLRRESAMGETLPRFAFHLVRSLAWCPRPPGGETN